MRGKLFKTITAAVCAAGLMLAGCGGDSAKSGGDTVKIGAIAEMTGANASYGTSMMRGTDFYCVAAAFGAIATAAC